MRRDVIVVGASAGGVDAVSFLVAGLPKDLPAAVFVVVHIPADFPSFLPEVLRRRTQLEVLRPEDRAPIRPGTVCVAPPDRHLLIEGNRVRVLKGPRENRHRSAVRGSRLR